MKKRTWLAAAAALLVLALGAAWLVLDAPGRQAPLVATGPLLVAERAGQFADGTVAARQPVFSPDASLLASSNVDGIVNLRRLPDMHLVRTIRHPQGVTSVAVAPDGSWFATAGYDGTVRLWDVASGRPIRTLSGATGSLWTVDVAPDGGRVSAAGEDKIARIWRTADGALLKQFGGHGRNIWEARFSPDGRRLGTASFDRTVRIWDAGTGALLSTLAEHEQAVVGLDFSRDGKWIASSGDDSTVRIWRAADGALVRTLPQGNHAYKVAFSRDGKWLASGGRGRSPARTMLHQAIGGGGEADAVRLWRVSDGALVGKLSLSDDVAGIAISPDTKWLAAASDDSQVTLWRLHGGDGR